MNTIQTSYQALPEENEAPSVSYMVHVSSDGGKSRWNHVVDLDAFFRNIYTFHQKNGLICIIVEDILWVLLLIFITFGLLYCVNCVDFNFTSTEIPLSALFMPLPVCASNFGVFSWILVVLFVAVLVIKLYKIIHKIYTFKEIQHFFESALKISKKELHNVTWHDVQCKLREVQHEQQMCVHKSDLTELDIYHRILRNKNYMVAMVNKNILPLKYNLKFFGEWVYFPSSLEYCLELLLFESPMAPFQGTGTLKEDYKKYSKRNECSAQLSFYILIVGISCFALCVFILGWRFLSYFLAYSGVLRYDPSFIGIHRWSAYSKLYLRHFNELDHELNARLGRAYKPAKEYTRSFSSPLVVVILKFLRQMVGFFVVFFTLWGLYNDRLFFMSHVLAIISVGTVIFAVLSNLIPDENEIFFPNQLMQRVISDTHYAPEHFKTMAHTTTVRDEFSHLFQYNIVYLLQELLSPLITPYVLLFHLRPRALDIVDFLRNFTVEVTGVGDVCSFALMDVSKHGNQQWLQTDHTTADQYQQAEGGKTEMSLIHFTLMNPHWQPPPSSNAFIETFKKQLISEKEKKDFTGNAYYSSLNSLTSMGSKYASLIMQQSLQQPIIEVQSINNSSLNQMRGGMRRIEGPSHIQDTILTNIVDEPFSLQNNCNPVEIRTTEMSLSALVLHGMHERQMEDSRSREMARRQNAAASEHDEDEGSPLLDMDRSNYLP